MEKKLEGKEHMTIGCINLETAYDTNTEVDGLPHAELRMVERTYEDTTSSVLCGPGMSGEFKVNVGLRQESALSPLLCIAAVDLINRTVGKNNVIGKLLYADDLAVVADVKADLQEQLIEWKDIFSKHGLRASLEKTKIMWVGQKKKELENHLNVQRLKKRHSFAIPTPTSAEGLYHRKVEGVMGVRQITRTLKRKLLT